MKRFFKIKKKIYRKYFGDIWGQVIIKGQLTRTFKFLLEIYRIKQIKSLFYGKKTALRLRKAYFHRKKLNLNNYDPTILTYYFDFFDKDRFIYDKDYKDHTIHNWKENFWRHFSNVYKYSQKSHARKKSFTRNHLSVLRLTSKHKLARGNRLKKFLEADKKVDFYKRVKKPANYSNEKHKAYIEKKRRFYNHISWLEVKHSWWKRKISNWWYVRMTEKRTAIFYGIFSVKKFRYIQNLSQKAMSLHVFYALKLEMMLNMVLFKLNIFNNIYFSNNFIKLNGILLNNRPVYYPFRSITRNDVVSFSKIYFKKIFNLFTLKLYHSRSLILKKAKKITNWQKAEKYFLINFLRNPRVVFDKPRYFVVNYKIMHALLWRFPKKSEITGSYVFPGSNAYDWNISTQLSYN